MYYLCLKIVFRVYIYILSYIPLHTIHTHAYQLEYTRIPCGGPYQDSRVQGLALRFVLRAQSGVGRRDRADGAQESGGKELDPHVLSLWFPLLKGNAAPERVASQIDHEPVQRAPNRDWGRDRFLPSRRPHTGRRSAAEAKRLQKAVKWAYGLNSESRLSVPNEFGLKPGVRFGTLSMPYICKEHCNDNLEHGSWAWCT